MNKITIQGARTHHLKNINLELPRNKLVVITGISGSGKSSLAFDTLYAEGQRRYVESLSTYARQFLSVMEKPDVDYIGGLSPAIAIEQKSTSHNPRSTVGTITEIYDYLRLLFARIGEPLCPEHKTSLAASTVSNIVDQVIQFPVDTKLMILAPVVVQQKGSHEKIIAQLQKQGYLRAVVNEQIYELSEIPTLQKTKKHSIAVLIDRIKVNEDQKVRLADSIETAISLTQGKVSIHNIDNNKIYDYSTKHACIECGYSISDLEPRMFSFNNPAGACQECNGIGHKQFMDINKIIYNDELSLAHGAIRGWDKNNFYYYSMITSLAKHYKFNLEIPFKNLSEDLKQKILFGTNKEKIKFTYASETGTTLNKEHPFEGIVNNMERRYLNTESNFVREELAKFLSNQQCTACNGSRLNIIARNVFIKGESLPNVTRLSIKDTIIFFKQLKFSGKTAEIADKILKEIIERLQFLSDVGLDYLSLDRKADTLSGGESQRIRLASQIGAGLVGVLYVLDEPSIGLHQRDNVRLLNTLFNLRDLGNTVVVVEHDEDTIKHSDFVVDLGPGAGIHGGQVVATGTPDDIQNNPNSLTGQYLSGKLQILPSTGITHKSFDKKLTISGARGNNLKNITVEFPIGCITIVTGVSGSGKSTLINETLYPVAAHKLNRAYLSNEVAPYDSITGLEHLDKIVEISQAAIGRTPRSNPATYTNLFTEIRDLFASTNEAKTRGYKSGRFSFNVKGGRCEACSGDGMIKVEMHFLSDLYVPCDTCNGKRYNRETLEIQYKGKNISQVLDMTVEQALEFFSAIPGLNKKLQTLFDVGLSYITLGQSATTLSGGEAQRIKLAKELAKRDTGNTLYLLDEPTTGLHFHDVKRLIELIYRLRDKGNTIIIIEHNLDMIRIGDWVIDLGPEGGHQGGEILVTGTPEMVSKCAKSHTGKFLTNYFK